MLWFAHRIFIADHERGPNLRAELQQMMIRKPTQNKADAALFQSFGNRWDSLIEKTVMPQIGVRIKRDRSKKDNARFAQRICRLHRHLKRGIIERPLRPLHPVDNARAVPVGFAGSTDSNTGIRR